MASTYLTKSQGTGNKEKFTYSAWVKKHSATAECVLLNSYTNSTNYSKIQIDSDGRFHFDDYQGSQVGRRSSTEKLRDVNAWYHLVAVWDTNNSTADDRMILYINGERVSAFDHDSDPSSGADSFINNNTKTLYIGRKENNNVSADMTLSHVHFSDGYALAPTVFGSTDSTTGEWKINTSPSFTLGTNGFTILKDGNTITDQSSNSNNFTLGAGTLTKTEDCPSNVFATFNPLHFQAGRALTMSNGNGKIASNQNNWQPIGSTLAVPPKTGKWYWEFSQFIEAQTFVGFISSECNININLPYQATDGMITYFYAGRLTNNGSETESYFTAISATTDVVGVALDMTAGTYGQVQFYLNGSATGSAVALSSAFANKFVMPFAMCNGTGGRSVSINTGNGYFGSTQISSAGTNASGIGIFEHNVPTGYTSLSTKGLNL